MVRAEQEDEMSNFCAAILSPTLTRWDDLRSMIAGFDKAPEQVVHLRLTGLSEMMVDI